MSPTPPSLHRHFALWLAAGACALLLFGLAWVGVQGYSHKARQQDERLLAAARQAWPASTGQAARLSFAERDGVVVRTAVAEREGAPLQLAEPAAERFPSPGKLAASPILRGLALGAVAMGAIAWVAWLRARRWVARSLAGLGQAARAEPPAELQPTLARVEALQRQQQDWVDEQRRFLAEAAHQLRTPLAVLRAEVQEALHGQGDPRPRLAGMLHTVDRATAVANHLLSLSRVEQLKRAGELGRVRLQACVREAIVEMSPLIAAKRLDFSLEGEDFEAAGDLVMLGELLRNLLGNAIHHSPPGARSGVVLRAAPFLEVVVWDEGPGVDDAVRPRLFTPFGAGRGGVGLGLSICQQVAAAMGAQVRLYDRVQEDRVAGVDAVVRWNAPT